MLVYNTLSAFWLISDDQIWEESLFL